MKAASGLVGSFVLATAAVGVVLLFFTLWNTQQIRHLAERPAPSLVQLSDGRTIRVEAKAPYAREPEVIRRFVAQALQGLFTWRHFIPSGTPGQPDSPDPGVTLSNRLRLPTGVFQTGFCLSEDLRSEFLRQLAALISKTLSGRSSQVLFTASFVGEPQAVAGRESYWKVTVIGQQVVYTQSQLEGIPLPFNKEIYVRAVDPPSSIEGFPETAFEKAIHQTRASGLEIYAIQSLSKDRFAPQ